ncbi:hypothetical protein OIU84_003154 [Salix udensis]|uniref:Uncharacterized protein n=1 Tax=Salix udensis TaxID=889485 RepID=A0AAD6K7Y1_9ROSI|nr:hypothetical protein OIU84_003154 [Salix udensis]
MRDPRSWIPKKRRKNSGLKSWTRILNPVLFPDTDIKAVKTRTRDPEIKGQEGGISRVFVVIMEMMILKSSPHKKIFVSEMPVYQLCSIPFVVVQSLETGYSGLMFPKLTISPLRRFQLIDSDSDSEEASISADASGKTQKTDSSSKKQQPTASERKNKMMMGKHQNDDLWKDFCPIKSSPVQTPVLDEMCNEYFQSLQGLRDWSAAGYSTFPHLGIVNSRENQLPTESVIDYMSQFNGEASRKQGTQRTNSEKGSARGRKKSKKSNAEEVSLASEGWVDPKSSNAIPKDAGKRRVHASGQGGGHWYTSPEGRKVYVSKSGQELSGKDAYRLYKKDSGGLRRSKKKTCTKGKGSQSQKKTNGKRKKG